MSRTPRVAAAAAAAAAAAQHAATTRKKVAAVAAAEINSKPLASPSDSTASTSEDSLTLVGSAAGAVDYSETSEDEQASTTPSDETTLDGQQEEDLDEEDEEDISATAEDLTGEAGQKKRIPAFVRKLRSMLDNKDVRLIQWTPDGVAFRVFDSVKFSRDVLPNYFKHNNWQSFIRQLNIYGFIKLTDTPHAPASSSAPQSDWSFRHPLFLRKYPHRMEEIKRRAPKTPKLDLDGTWTAAKARVGAMTSTAPSSSKPQPAADGLFAGALGKRDANGKPKSSSASSSASSSTSSGSSTAVESVPERKDVPGTSKAAAAAASAPAVASATSAAPRSRPSRASAAKQRTQPQATAQAGRQAQGRSGSSGKASQQQQPQQQQQQPPAAPSGPPTVKSLQTQVESLRSQVGSMQRKMKGMAKAQARAISLTAGVLATQLEGRDSSIASIKELQQSLANWQRACTSAVSAAEGEGGLMVRLSKRRAIDYDDSPEQSGDSDAGSDDDDDDDNMDEDDGGAGNVPVSQVGAAVGMVIDTGFLQQQPPQSTAHADASLAALAPLHGAHAMGPLAAMVPGGMPVHAAHPHALQLYHAASPAPLPPTIRLGDDPLHDVTTDDDGDDHAFPVKRRRSE